MEVVSSGTKYDNPSPKINSNYLSVRWGELRLTKPFYSPSLECFTIEGKPSFWVHNAFITELIFLVLFIEMKSQRFASSVAIYLSENCKVIPLQLQISDLRSLVMGCADWKVWPHFFEIRRLQSVLIFSILSHPCSFMFYYYLFGVVVSY